MENSKIVGMSCGHCVESVTKALTELGLTSVKVDLKSGTASYDHNPNISKETIKEAVEGIGFEVV